MKQLSKDRLETLYRELPNKEVCRKLNISQGTLVKILKNNNIKLKGKSGRVSTKLIIVD